MATVTLSNGKTFESEGAEKSIIDAALANQLMLEHSCRNGRCGVCKSRVLDGETETIIPELFLTEEDRKLGFILSCCRSAITDVRLDTKDIDGLRPLAMRTLPCRIDTLTQQAEDLITVSLRTPPGSALEYIPGQYVQIISKTGVRRSYSIANAPRPDGKIELHIRHFPGGEMSQYWFNSAAVNDLLYMEVPFGTFVYRRSSRRDLIFLATGTGIAPVKAILEALDAAPDLTIDKTIRVYWGMRYQDEFYWTPEFENLAVQFVPVLSRPTAAWIGKSGYVQTALLDDGFEVNQSTVYACGSEEMIAAARSLLLTKGLEPEQFHSDAFVESN